MIKQKQKIEFIIITSFQFTPCIFHQFPLFFLFFSSSIAILEGFMVTNQPPLLTLLKIIIPFPCSHSIELSSSLTFLVDIFDPSHILHISAQLLPKSSYTSISERNSETFYSN